MDFKSASVDKILNARAPAERDFAGIILKPQFGKKMAGKKDGDEEVARLGSFTRRVRCLAALLSPHFLPLHLFATHLFAIHRRI